MTGRQSLRATMRLRVHRQRVSSCSRRVSTNWRKVQASSYSAGVWCDNAWKFLVPSVGWRVHVEDERLALSWVDGAWRDRLVGTANGGAFRLVALEQELTLAGAFVETTTALIVDRMIVLAGGSRTTQAITGATSYSVGRHRFLCRNADPHHRRWRDLHRRQSAARPLCHELHCTGRLMAGTVSDCSTFPSQPMVVEMATKPGKDHGEKSQQCHRRCRPAAVAKRDPYGRTAGTVRLCGGGLLGVRSSGQEPQPAFSRLSPGDGFRGGGQSISAGITFRIIFAIFTDRDDSGTQRLTMLSVP
jgi:Protein of unknown function (DUF2793)